MSVLQQIDPEKLKEFYGNKRLMESVYLSILDFLDKKALELVYRGDDPKGIPLAKDAVDDMLLDLHEKYGKKVKPKPRTVR